MRALTAPLKDLAGYEEMLKQLQTQHTVLALSGCVDSQKLHMVYGLGEGFACKLIVTFSDLRAREFMRIINFMTEMSCCFRQRI